ncbi:DNA methyltransferase [Pontimonas sp.]|uniref:DNA-methyltransferase n=1 Tax=Pontimonas sp. TaxID=2304492 RepID=UPI0028700AC8|nr:DNA methyltransferase [Pontimonas sp.]MDR9397371.1 DNA methyltransferase [Pontimonas sp.]
MEPSVVVENARVFLGDCREVLKTLPDNSVDSVVTDPPYELGFMGKKWDSSGIAYDVTVWEECLRVLKPGGHILAFGGTRTWHRLAVAVEDAGFEIRDNIAWMYGSGFPKSLDVSKAIDKAAGAERELRVNEKWSDRYPNGPGGNLTQNGQIGQLKRISGNPLMTSDPVTPEAEKWSGWGTALKPAFEPVVVGRKPVEGTVANNVLAWGVGGLNIDGSRIGATGGTKDSDFIPGTNTAVNAFDASGRSGALMKGTTTPTGQGRWPANVILDEVTAGLLDEQSGVSKSPTGAITQGGQIGKFGHGEEGYGKRAGNFQGHGDSGGASRFFYVAKASKRDRNEGLEDLGERNLSDRGADGQRDKNSIVTRQTVTKNFHPTVKPTALMRYLIKLVTPEGGVVLDPFTGSGSTGKAALLDRFEFVGAELTEDYLPIIEGRLKWAVENREDGALF